MKKKILAVIVIICVLFSAFMYTRYYDAWKRKANAMSSDTLRSEEHDDITWDLITMVEHNSELKQLLEKSIRKARETNPDPDTNPVDSLESYYSFIDRVV